MAHEMNASDQMVRILRDHGGALPMVDLLRLTDLSPGLLAAISEQNEAPDEEATDEPDLGIVFDAGAFRVLLARVSLERGTAEDLAAALAALDVAKPASALTVRKDSRQALGEAYSYHRCLRVAAVGGARRHMFGVGHEVAVCRPIEAADRKGAGTRRLPRHHQRW
jgi:hypothetical protein